MVLSTARQAHNISLLGQTSAVTAHRRLPPLRWRTPAGDVVPPRLLRASLAAWSAASVYDQPAPTFTAQQRQCRLPACSARRWPPSSGPPCAHPLVAAPLQAAACLGRLCGPPRGLQHGELGSRPCLAWVCQRWRSSRAWWHWSSVSSPSCAFARVQARACVVAPPLPPPPGSTAAGLGLQHELRSPSPYLLPCRAQQAAGVGQGPGQDCQELPDSGKGAVACAATASPEPAPGQAPAVLLVGGDCQPIATVPQ